jgi:hypothetical protein
VRLAQRSGSLRVTARVRVLAADAGAVWNTRLDELFTNLLFAIATDVRFKFDRVQLKKGVYSPQAHGDLERDQITARKLALEVLGGTRAIKMDVASFPNDEEALRAQTELHKALAQALTGQGPVTIAIKRDGAGVSGT